MFSGFPPEGLKFMRGLAKNNDREWFQPRKETFESKVKTPMAELVEAINGELMKFAPEYVNDPKKAMYRIYRDTRFSSDKTPYKTHIAAIFPKRGLEKHISGSFYFHVATKSVGVGAGVYMPGPEQLLAIRTWLTDHHEEFRKATKVAAKLWGPMLDNATARSPKGFDPNHAAADLVSQKAWLFWQEIDIELATTPKLLPELCKRFRAAAPVLQMLNAPLRNPKPAGFVE